jgi:hypothetical protein
VAHVRARLRGLAERDEPAAAGEALGQQVAEPGDALRLLLEEAPVGLRPSRQQLIEPGGDQAC